MNVVDAIAHAMKAVGAKKGGLPPFFYLPLSHSASSTSLTSIAIEASAELTI